MLICNVDDWQNNIILLQKVILAHSGAFDLFV